MTRTVRIAMTETVNAYTKMPNSLEGISRLTHADLEEIRAANLEHHAALMRAASESGVELICFGELFAAPYFALAEQEIWKHLAEDVITGTTPRTIAKHAAELGIICVAPMYELDSETGNRFNTAVVFDSEGTAIGKYRKCHIPDGENDENSFTESYYYGKSDGNLGSWPQNVSNNRFFPVIATKVCRLGIAICYDRHFPGVMTALANQGAEVVVCPSVTFGAKSRRMWDKEFEVDAARENLFIVGSNRRGAESPWNQPFFGESYAAGPNGRRPRIDSSASNLAIFDVDLDELSAPDPSGWNLQRDRRRDIYS